MNGMVTPDAMAALTARRAIQATLNADRRSARLQAARRHEDELFAGAERLTLTIGGLLRRLRKSEAESTSPSPLQLPERTRVDERADRDAA